MALVASVALMASAAPAYALQPLETFVAAGRTKAPDNQEAKASRDVLDGQHDVAVGRVLPGVSAQATYTRNQYDSQIQLPAEAGQQPVTVTITPIDQLDAFVAVSVPLVNLSNFWQIKAARIAREAGDLTVLATQLAIEAQVTQDYYQLVANMALVAESDRALDVAKQSMALTQAQFKAGSVAELDVDRASNEVERNVQQVASAQLQVVLSAQALETVTGVKADITQIVIIEDDLHPEPAITEFQPAEQQIPSVAAAIKNRESADVAADAQRLTLVPSLQGTFTERFTNASGFSGNDASWQAVLSLTWAFDWSTIGGIRVQDANARVIAARENRARLAANDAIVRTWSTVSSSITRSRSARVQVKSANHASQLAMERYRVGATTQLELLQAQRDAFTAEVSRIQADADLVNARLQLRIAAGRDPLNPQTK